jgi:hypothetical protein
LPCTAPSILEPTIGPLTMQTQPHLSLSPPALDCLLPPRPCRRTAPEERTRVLCCADAKFRRRHDVAALPEDKGRKDLA